MNLVQITPGGALDCGSGLHDHALVAELRRQGHDVTMIPLFVPLTSEEGDQSAGTPLFYPARSVRLDQTSSFFRGGPGFVRAIMASWLSPARPNDLLAKASPDEVGDLTLSLLRGEEGFQARELAELIGWLKRRPKPEVVCLSNTLLLGMARRLKAELQVPVVCWLQAGNAFLDTLPQSRREAAWQLMAERAAEADLFFAPSRFIADLMVQRLRLSPEQVRIIPCGINLEGYTGPKDKRRESRLTQNAAPVLGYFAPMSREHGLDTLVEAFIHVKHREQVPRLKLHLGGRCDPADEAFVKSIRQRLAEAGYIGETSFSPNVNRAERIASLEALSVFSVPAGCGEAFGLYAVEAMAAGVPVVLPRTAAFPELVEATGGGVLCDPGDAKLLANAIENLLLDPEKARALGDTARNAVFERFSIEATVDAATKALAELVWLKTR